MRKSSLTVRMAIAAVAGMAAGVSAPQSFAAAAIQKPATPMQAPATVTTSPSQPPALPLGVSEVVKLYQAGISKDIIVNYIHNTGLPYHLDANGITYVRSLGMPQEIINVMIQRDGQLQQESLRSYYPPQTPGTTVSPDGKVITQYGDVVTPTTPPPDVTVIGPDYPYYYDGYPYYGYDYWPPVVVGGWGWGHGWGRGHGDWGHGWDHGYHGSVGGFHGGFSGGSHGGGHGGGGHR
jgi:hypothetical protein